MESSKTVCSFDEKKMKIVLILLLQLINFSFSYAGLEFPVVPLKVLTLNFNSEEVINDSNHYVRDRRFNGIKEWVKKNDPDIILLEEAWSYRGDRSVAVSLAHAIGYDVSYRLEMGFYTFLSEADAVLTKKNLNMTEHYAFKLPHSAPEIGNGTTWEIELGAVSYAVGAKLKMSNGLPLYAFATHLTGKTAADRADQVAAVIAHIKAIGKKDGIPWDQIHAIVGGDFNSTIDELGPQAMLSDGFLDTYGIVHPNDVNCTLCEEPLSDWFNPFTIASGLFPSQAQERDSVRIDYIFSHGPTLKPFSSVLTFTAPQNGVWMSDHYGLTTEFSGQSNNPISNITHDSDGTMVKAVINTINDEIVNCVLDKICSNELPVKEVKGARGIVFENNGQFNLQVIIKGPGYIFANNSAYLAPNERASFSFSQVGNFDYTIYINSTSVNESSPTLLTRLNGKINVVSTGY